MIETLLYLGCGLTAGLLGGYLGLGGGIVMVPYLTVAAGIDFKTAVPVSVTAIVVNSLTASNEYLKKGMADIEMVVLLALFMVVGNIGGSLLSQVVPTHLSKLLFTIMLVYTAFSLLKNQSPQDSFAGSTNRSRYTYICMIITLITGILAGLLGVGGGVVLVPLMYLVVGMPFSSARGTSSLMIGFSSAGAAAVYFLNNQIDYHIVAPVIAGVVIGGKIGGLFGTAAKPKVVKIAFFIIMLYLAFKLAYGSLAEML